LPGDTIYIYTIYIYNQKWCPLLNLDGYGKWPI
jgi:hypothetical protein